MSDRLGTVGIVGGMSWASTLTYYRVLNEEIIRLTRGKRCGSIRIISFDSSEIEQLIDVGAWQVLAEKISEAARSLVEAGSEIIVVASNTAHIAFEHYPKFLHVKALHIADAIVERVQMQGADRLGFIGTSATLSNLVSGRLSRRLGFVPEAPDPSLWGTIDEAIFTRLCRGTVVARDKKAFESIILQMKNSGITNIVLGCTEIGLLFSIAEKADLGLLDSAEVHASIAARRALAVCRASEGVGAI